MSTSDATAPTAPEGALPYEGGPEPEHAHVLPLALYLKVFGALIFLTIVTVGVSYAGLGRLSIAVALLVAAVKAGFVVGFFMHLRYDLRFYSLLFFGSLIFIALFFGLTMVDLSTRGSLNPEEATFSKQKEAWDRTRAEQWKKEAARLFPGDAGVEGAPVAPPGPTAPTGPAARPTDDAARPTDDAARPSGDATPTGDAPGGTPLVPPRPGAAAP